MVIEDINNAFDQFEGTPSNRRTFSSGVFPLEKGTERISMAEIHSMDNIQGFPGDEPDVPALFALRKQYS